MNAKKSTQPKSRPILKQTPQTRTISTQSKGKTYAITTQKTAQGTKILSATIANSGQNGRELGQVNSGQRSGKGGSLGRGIPNVDAGGNGSRTVSRPSGLMKTLPSGLMKALMPAFEQSQTGRERSLAYDPAKYTSPVSLNSGKSEVDLNQRNEVSGSNDNNLRIKGDMKEQTIISEDYIGSVSSLTTTKNGDVLFSRLLNPAMFSETRLARLASCYKRCVIKRMKFEFRSVLPATAAGAIAMYIEPDPNYVLPGGQFNLSVAASNPSFAMANVWANLVSEKEFTDNFQRYVDPLSSDLRLVDNGAFIVLAASDFTTAQTVGQLFMISEIAFCDPELNSNPFTGYSTTADTTSKGYTLNNSYPFGTQTGFLFTNPSNIPVQYKPSAYSQFYLPPGQFSYFVYITGTGLAGPTWAAGPAGFQIQSFGVLNGTVNAFFGGTLAINPNSIAADRWIRFYCTGATTITFAYVVFSQTTALYSWPSAVDDLEARVERLEEEVKDEMTIPTSKNWVRLTPQF